MNGPSHYPTIIARSKKQPEEKWLEEETYSKLSGVLLNQEISILLGIVPIASVVVGHHVIVQVVIASHPHKEDAFGNGLCYSISTKPVCDLVERVPKVTDLLVEGNATHLKKN